MKQFIVGMLALAGLVAACHWHAAALEPIAEPTKPAKVHKDDEGSEHHMEPMRITIPVTRIDFTPEVVTAKRPRLTLVGCTEYVCDYEYR